MADHGGRLLGSQDLGATTSTVPSPWTADNMNAVIMSNSNNISNLTLQLFCKTEVQFTTTNMSPDDQVRDSQATDVFTAMKKKLKELTPNSARESAKTPSAESMNAAAIAVLRARGVPIPPCLLIQQQGALQEIDF